MVINLTNFLILDTCPYILKYGSVLTGKHKFAQSYSTTVWTVLQVSTDQNFKKMNQISDTKDTTSDLDSHDPG